MEKLETYFELEAGSITTKIEDGELKFLIVNRIKWGDYVLPKGHVEEKETLEKTSIRETLEETGYPIKIVDFVDSFEYKVKEDKWGEESFIIRRVYHFLGEVIGEKIENENSDEKEGKTVASWMTYEEALSNMSYNNDKDLVKKVFNLLK